MINKAKNNNIAPCGMNCALCLGFQREKNKCPGCRNIKITKSKYIRKCIIKNCPILKEKDLKYCSSKCEKYPCTRLKNLDTRYRKRYRMSMIENLTYIQKYDIEKFIDKENKKWKCSKCGSLLCVHRTKCLKCESNK